MTDAQLYAYERFWMAVYDEQAISEGRYIKGRAEGEQAKAIENARKMKAKNYPVADIAEMTGLTIDIVNGL